MRLSPAFLITAAVALTAGWAFGSPYWTLKQMRDAAQAKDTDALAAYVDFPALREDVKSELSAKVMADSAKEEGGLAGLSKMFGLAMVDKIVDGMISPTGLRVMFAGADVADGADQSPMQVSLGDVDIERTGLSEFKLHITKPGDEKAVLVFHRDGLGWKLAGLDLPADAK